MLLYWIVLFSCTNCINLLDIHTNKSTNKSKFNLYEIFTFLSQSTLKKCNKIKFATSPGNYYISCIGSFGDIIFNNAMNKITKSDAM